MDFQWLQCHKVSRPCDQLARVAFKLLRVGTVTCLQFVDDGHPQQALFGVLHQVLMGNAHIVFTHGFQHIQKSRFRHPLVKTRKTQVWADFLNQCRPHATGLGFLLSLIHNQAATDGLDLTGVVEPYQVLAHVAATGIRQSGIDCDFKLLERLLQCVGRAIYLALQVSDFSNDFNQQRLGKPPAFGAGAVHVHFLQKHAVGIQQAVGRAQHVARQQTHTGPFLRVAKYPRLGLLFSAAGTRDLLVTGF